MNREEQFRQAILDDPDSDDALRVYADWLQSQRRVQGELITVMLAGGRGSDPVRPREQELARDPGLWPKKLQRVEVSAAENTLLPRDWRTCDRISAQWDRGLLDAVWFPPVLEGADVDAALDALGWSVRQLALSPRHLDRLHGRALPRLEQLILDACHGRAGEDLYLPTGFRVPQLDLQGLASLEMEHVDPLLALGQCTDSLHVRTWEADVYAVGELTAEGVKVEAGPAPSRAGPMPRIDRSATPTEEFCQHLAHHIAWWGLPRGAVPIDLPEPDWDELLIHPDHTQRDVYHARDLRLVTDGPYVPPADGHLHGGAILAWLADECTQDGLLDRAAPPLFRHDVPHPALWLSTFVYDVPWIQPRFSRRLESIQERAILSWIPEAHVTAVDEEIPALPIDYFAWVHPNDPVISRILPDWMLAIGGQRDGLHDSNGRPL